MPNKALNTANGIYLEDEKFEQTDPFSLANLQGDFTRPELGTVADFQGSASSVLEASQAKIGELGDTMEDYDQLQKIARDTITLQDAVRQDFAASFGEGGAADTATALLREPAEIIGDRQGSNYRIANLASQRLEDTLGTNATLIQSSLTAKESEINRAEEKRLLEKQIEAEKEAMEDANELEIERMALQYGIDTNDRDTESLITEIASARKAELLEAQANARRGSGGGGGGATTKKLATNFIADSRNDVLGVLNDTTNQLFERYKDEYGEFDPSEMNKGESETEAKRRILIENGIWDGQMNDNDIAELVSDASIFDIPASDVYQMLEKIGAMTPGEYN